MAILLNERGHFIDCHLRVDFAIDGNGRSKSASAHAADGFDGEETIGSRLTGFDAKNRLELLDDRLAGFDIASCAKANANHVLSFRGERKEVVERHDAENLGDRDASLFRNDFLNFQRDVTVLFLNLAQNDHERRGFVFVHSANGDDVFPHFSPNYHIGLLKIAGFTRPRTLLF